MRLYRNRTGWPAVYCGIKLKIIGNQFLIGTVYWVIGNRIGRNDTGDHFDSRRFSRPVRPQKAENLPAFRLKREVINRFSRRPSIRF